MYDYTHMDELSPRKQNTIKNTYSRFTCDYEYVDQLVPAVGAEENTNEEE
jgi:hypothetical protein